MYKKKNFPLTNKSFAYKIQIKYEKKKYFFQNFKFLKKKTPKTEKQDTITARLRHDHGTITHRTRANPPQAQTHYFHCI